MTRRHTVTTEIAIPHLTARGGTWYYERRVPRHLAHLVSGKRVRQATGIALATDPDGTRVAAQAVAKINTDVEQGWNDLLAGRDPAERKRAVRAIEQAAVIGLPYRAADDVAVLDLPNIFRRTEMLGREQARIDAGGPPLKVDAMTALTDATLGGIAKSGILVSALPEIYFGIVAADHRKKSANQLRVFKNRKKAACANFVKVNGDMDFLAITTPHAQAFHRYWSDRIIAEKKKPGSANKDIGNLRSMIEVVAKHYKLTDPKMFDGMGFKKEKNKRKAFTAQFVLDNIWPAGAMPSLNAEARDLMHVFIETGARPAELCALDRNTIFLNVNIPYIHIIEEHQEVKTEQSIREVPLVGRALEIMRRYPNGFRRYHLKATNFCATVNKALKKLQPDVAEAGGKFQTSYCIRHLFKDRMRHAGIDAELRLAIMGHEHDEDNPNVGNAPDYGEGFAMVRKKEALEKIAFPL